MKSVERVRSLPIGAAQVIALGVGFPAIGAKYHLGGLVHLSA